MYTFTGLDSMDWHKIMDPSLEESFGEALQYLWFFASGTGSGHVLHDSNGRRTPTSFSLMALENKTI
jgi:hypothetical protein